MAGARIGLADPQAGDGAAAQRGHRVDRLPARDAREPPSGAGAQVARSLRDDGHLRAQHVPLSNLKALSALPKDGRTVVVLQDAFTSFYEPSVLVASCLLLRALGYSPHVLPYFENGKALHIKGFLGAFKGVVQKNTARLREVAALGFPMLGVEPAVVLTYRDEYPKELGEETGFRVHLLQEWLAEQPLPAL
jgi:Fe-S oxidoreductase